MDAISKALLAAALLGALLSACASTVPTERSRAADEAVREQEVSDARLENAIRLALLEARAGRPEDQGGRGSRPDEADR